VRKHVVQLPLRSVCTSAAGCNGTVEVSATGAAGCLATVVIRVYFCWCAVGTNAVAEGALEAETAV
jgi:hypothetical protein